MVGEEGDLYLWARLCFWGVIIICVSKRGNRMGKGDLQKNRCGVIIKGVGGVNGGDNEGYRECLLFFVRIVFLLLVGFIVVFHLGCFVRMGEGRGIQTPF